MTVAYRAAFGMGGSADHQCSGSGVGGRKGFDYVGAFDAAGAVAGERLAGDDPGGPGIGRR